MRLPARAKSPKMGCREETRIRLPVHLKHVRGHICAISGREGHVCEGSVIAHHVHEDADGGTGIKPSDCYAIPLCDGAHVLLHLKGETWFQAHFKIDLVALAAAFWRMSPHRLLWQKAHPAFQVGRELTEEMLNG